MSGLAVYRNAREECDVRDVVTQVLQISGNIVILHVFTPMDYSEHLFFLQRDTFGPHLIIFMVVLHSISLLSCIE